MEKTKNFLKNNILDCIIIVIFIVLAVFMSQYHEYWSDEAQSWLIARDCSVSEILKVTKYEGTPCWWVLIIKVFMVFGLTYEYFYVIPIVFMALGLLFVFKKFDFPWYMKVLFPFTYYIFFQNTMIARSYSLVLLGFAMTYYYFQNREKSMFKYILSSLFLMGQSLFTYGMSGAFYILQIINLIRRRKEIDERFKKNEIISIIVLTIAFLLIFIMILPTMDIGSGGIGGRDPLYVIGETTISNDSFILDIIGTIIFVGIYVFLYFKQEKEKRLDYLLELLIYAPVLLIYIIIQGHIRYFGILFIIMFLHLIKYKNYKIIKAYLIILLLVHVFWNFSNCKLEKTERYSSGEEIANFIKALDYKNKTIDTIYYHSVAVSPYFEENIYKSSLKTDKSFYLWSIENGYAPIEEIVENKSNIYVIPLICNRADDDTVYAQINNCSKLYEFMKNANLDDYYFYIFESHIIHKGRINEKDQYLVIVDKKTNEEVLSKGLEAKLETRIYELENYEGEIESFDMKQINSK